MLLLLTKPAIKEQIDQMISDYQGYIKLTIDVNQEIIAGGGERHVDGEQLLLSHGSKQENIWGGGIDWETKEIDYNSMINLRPSDGNPSRDVLSINIRKQFDAVIKKLLLNT